MGTQLIPSWQTIDHKPVQTWKSINWPSSDVTNQSKDQIPKKMGAKNSTLENPEQEVKRLEMRGEMKKENMSVETTFMWRKHGEGKGRKETSFSFFSKEKELVNLGPFCAVRKEVNFQRFWKSGSDTSISVPYRNLSNQSSISNSNSNILMNPELNTEPVPLALKRHSWS